MQKLTRFSAWKPREAPNRPVFIRTAICVVIHVLRTSEHIDGLSNAKKSESLYWLEHSEFMRNNVTVGNMACNHFGGTTFTENCYSLKTHFD